MSVARSQKSTFTRNRLTLKMPPSRHFSSPPLDPVADRMSPSIIYQRFDCREDPLRRDLRKHCLAKGDRGLVQRIGRVLRARPSETGQSSGNRLCRRQSQERYSLGLLWQLKLSDSECKSAGQPRDMGAGWWRMGTLTVHRGAWVESRNSPLWTMS